MEKYLCIQWPRIPQPAHQKSPAPSLLAVLCSQTEPHRFGSERLQVSESPANLYSITFLSLRAHSLASLFLQKDAGLSYTSTSSLRCLQVEEGSYSAFQVRGCAQPAAAELPYQELKLVDVKHQTEVHLKS